MVKRSLLEKLSDKELLNYVSPNSRYVADAVEIAFDILKKRNIIFQEEESLAIEALILKKREQEEIVYREPVQESFDDYITADPDAISLFSQNSISLFAFIFGVPFCGFLIMYNLYKLNKSSIAVIILIMAIAFTGIIYMVNPHFLEIINQFSSETSAEGRFKRLSPYFLSLIAMGSLMFLYVKNVEKGIEFRSKSIIVPFVLCFCGCLILYFQLGFIPGFSILYYLLNSLSIN